MHSPSARRAVAKSFLLGLDPGLLGLDPALAPAGAVGQSFVLGFRRGPVNDRETTGNCGVAWERNRAAQGAIAPSPQVGPPKNLAKVGVAGSSPVVRSKIRCLTCGNAPRGSLTRGHRL